MAVWHQFQNFYWWLFDTNFKILIDSWQTSISYCNKLLASTILRIELPLEFTVEQFFVRNWLKFHDLCLPLLDENWTCSNDKSYVILLQITDTCNVWMCLKHICHICNLKWKCVTAGRHQFQNWYWWLADTNFKIDIDGCLTPISKFLLITGRHQFQIDIDCWQTPFSKLILMAVWHQFQNCYRLLTDTNFKLI